MSNGNGTYDIIICGAGSAGLSTAVFCARKGMKVLVLEKNAATGAFPRGETLRPDPIITELLGPDFMERISTNRTAKRRYWCPGGRKSFSLERFQASYLFHWKDLTEGLSAAAQAAGAQILFNCEVTAPVLQNQRCIGVQSADGSRFFARTVIAADGHNSVLGKFCGLDYRGLNCPIAKRICSGIETDYDGMEYFFIPSGTLAQAPDLPPAVAFIFPRGEGEAEVGLMLLMAAVPEKRRVHAAPNLQRMLIVLQGLTTSYPGFSGRLKNARTLFEGVSMIPMAGLHPRTAKIPGLVLVGDAIGLVEASGGCGIVATMKQGAWLADFLEQNEPLEWDDKTAARLNREFQRSAIFRHIRNKYRKVVPLMRLLFHKPRPVSHFERLWDLLGFLYRRT